MSYKLTVLVPGHLIYIQHGAQITQADLDTFDVEVSALMEASPLPLQHGIYNYSNVQVMPTIRQIIALKSARHPRAGWVLMVGLKTPVTRFIISAAVQMMRLRLRFFETTDQAIAFIQDVDSTLPPLDAPAIREAMAALDAEMTLSPVAASGSSPTMPGNK